MVNINEICKSVGVPFDEVMQISKYLEGEMLMKSRAMGGGVSITHEGIKEIEKARENPDKGTMHFPAINNIIYVENMNQSQVQQGTTDSTQSYINNSSSEVLELLKGLLVEIDNEKIDENIKEAAKANVEIIKTQIALPDQYKDKTLAQKSWSFLSKSSALVSVGDFVTQHASKVLPLLGL